MKIHITRGIYGYRKNGNVVEKTKNDPPFEVDDEEGNRLISLLVAEYADNAGKASESVMSMKKAEKDNPCGESGDMSKEDLENLSKEELYRLAEEYGVKKNGSKADLVERLIEAFLIAEKGEHIEDDEMPELTAEEPE